MKPFTVTGAFAPEIPQHGAGLRLLALKGAGMTLFSGLATMAIQVIATVTLARLLSPREIGLVVMVTTFSLLLMNCGYAGMTDAVVQCERMDNALASVLFWINLGVGALLTLLFCAAGPWLARFYHEPMLAGITAALSVTIFLTSCSVLHLALLKRAMLFQWVALNDIVSRALSVAVSVYGACHGWGYWAIVAGSCAQPACVTLGGFALCRWRPLRPRSTPGAAPVLRFALQTYGRFCLNFVTRNADNLLVGSCLGASALGFYKRAYDLFAMSGTQISTAIYPVAVASLSRLRPNEGEYRRFLLQALSLLSLLGMGVAGWTALIGPDIIRVLLGPGWGQTGRIFCFFAPGIGIMLLYNAHSWIHPSIGRADRWLLWGVVECALTCALFVLGLHWGAEGVALSWTLSFWLLAAPALWYAGAPIRLGLGAIYRQVWRFILAALAAALLAARIGLLLPWRPGGAGMADAIGRIVLYSALFLLLYLAGIIVLHGGAEPLRRVGRVLRQMLGRSAA